MDCTIPETKITSENGCLEDEIPFGAFKPIFNVLLLLVSWIVTPQES